MAAAANPVVAAAGEVDWKASLPEDLRADKAFEPIKDIAGLAKSFSDAQKYIGGAVKMPKSDAPPEEWNKFYGRLGRPESADKYEFKRPEMPEGAQYDEGMEKEFRNWAHAQGLNGRQAQGLLDAFSAHQMQSLQTHKASMEEGVATLKKEWGGEYDKKLGFATRAVKELGGDELTKLLNDTGLGNHPTLVKLFANIGANLQEDTLVIGDSPDASNSRDALQLKLDTIMRDPKHPYNDSSASYEAHQAAVREVSNIHKQLG